MSRCYKQSLSAHSIKRGQEPFNFDAFVSNVYLPHMRLRKRSWRVDERISQRYLSPAFGDKKLSTIERQEVELWLHELAFSGLAPASCNRIIAVFKTICTLAEQYGVFSPGFSPAAGVKPLKVRTLRERYLTPDEAQRLFQELNAHLCPDSLAILLLLLTGARKSEILKARWEYVRQDLRLLVVPLSKSGKPRYIPLSEAAMEVLRALPRSKNVPWLFPGRDPEKPRSDIFPFWSKVRRKLGLFDVRIHDLRHTFASFLVNTGHSLYEAQKLLGHTDPRTTTRYAHLGQAALLAAAEAVSSIFTPREKNRSLRKR